MHQNRLQATLAGQICFVVLLLLSALPVSAQESQEQHIAELVASLETRPVRAVVQLRAIDAATLRASASAVAAVPMLAKLVKNSRESDIRSSAITILGKIGPAAAAAVPALVEALGIDSKNGVGDGSDGAAEALGKIGPAAASAVPALIQAINDITGGGAFRAAAAQALGKIGSAAEVVPALMGVLRGGDGTQDGDVVRYAVADALGNLGPSAASAAPLLVEALGDHGPRGTAVGSAAGALMKMGDSIAYVLPDLIKVLRDSRLQRWTGDSWSSPEPDTVARSSAAMVIVNTGLTSPAVSALAASLGKSGSSDSAKALAELSRSLHKNTANLKDDALSAAIKDIANTQQALETEIRGNPANGKQLRSGSASLRSMLGALRKEQARRRQTNLSK